MQYLAFLPELIVIGAAFLVLLLEAAAPKRSILSSMLLASFALLGSFYALQFTPDGNFNNVLVSDRFSVIFRQIITGASLILLVLSLPYLKGRVSGISEFCFLYLTSTFGLMLVTGSQNFIVFVVCLESASLGMFVLAASMRNEKASLEAGIKFFLASSFATAIMLWGLSILFGLAGSLDFGSVRSMLSLFTSSSGTLDIKPFHLLGLLALIVGLGFKITLFPFHLWAPDVYQGSPTPFTAFLATVSKAAGIAIIIRILAYPVSPFLSDFKILLVVMSALTMLAASSAALMQTDSKRLLAYSSISHAGFLAIGLAAFAAGKNPEALASVIFYMIAYVLATTGAFIVLYTLEARHGKSHLTVFNGLWKSDPPLAFAMVIFIASLAGLPPTIGFVGKFMLFASAWATDLMALLVVALVSTVISLFFYFKIIRCMLLNSPEEETSSPDIAPRLIAISMAVAVLVMLFYSKGLMDICLQAAKVVAER